jgi:protein-disulfide isomerase
MASRTKQKEEARARRLAEERERTERARRDRRLRTIGGTVLIAIAVVVIAIAASSSGGSSPTGLQTGKKATSTVTTVNNLLNGIPQSGTGGTVLGNAKAPVTMTYYADLECPICQAFTVQGGFSQLVSNDVRAGKVKIVYRSFESATSSPTVFKSQQVAAMAAGMQQKFWNYVELFYREQGQEGSGYVNEAYLQGLAKQVTGLSLSAWEADRNNSSLTNQVVSDENGGTKAGVQGTPTLVFTGPKGSAAITSGVPTYSQLQQ